MHRPATMALYAASVLCAVIMFSTTTASAAGEAPKQADMEEPQLPPLMFEDITFDYELRRTLGYAVAGGADINESLHAAHAILPDNGESWFNAWNDLAHRTRTRGATALANDHTASAREAFLRASNYYRTAAFFLPKEQPDPRILTTARLSRETFRRAATLMDRPVQIIRIPYDGATLPGYFLQPDHSGAQRKTLILQTGFDGTGEELYFTAVPALDRGWNVLVFEGPGQGAALLEQGLRFRHDWENVVTPVVDYALGRPEVDPGKLALMGLSMGGFLAPRAAAFEHRLAACVANPGQFDLYGGKRPSPEDWSTMRADPDATNTALRGRMGQNLGFRWWIDNGMFTTGARTPLEFMQFWGEFTLNGVARNIRCPTLVIGGNADHFLTLDDSRVLYETLQCSKTFLQFLGEDQANMHCQVGALTAGAAIFDWLDETVHQ